MYAFSRKLLLTVAVCLLLTCGCLAAQGETMYDTEYCFSEADFCVGDMGSVDGIFVSDIPDESVALVKLGNRCIRAGDVLSASSLNQLRLIPLKSENCEATLSYLPIYGSYLADPAVVTVRIQNGKNDPPKVGNVEFETYKNIANDGKLTAEDPEKGAMTYQLVDAPKRGTVELNEDGTFRYTPEKNKVGEDRFTYTATDDAGNVSKPATVNIRILKPTDQMTYSDMQDDPMHFEAMWLKEQGLYGGKRIGTQQCFCPDETVTKGEFLVMAMELLKIPAEEDCTLCTFTDCPQQWLCGYLASALRHGMVRGEQGESGLCFYPDKPITGQEAAVMLQNMLQLPVPAATTFSGYPAWSAKAVLAMSDAGISADFDAAVLTRSEAAALLYQISRL